MWGPRTSSWRRSTLSWRIILAPLSRCWRPSLIFSRRSPTRTLRIEKTRKWHSIASAVLGNWPAAGLSSEGKGVIVWTLKLFKYLWDGLVLLFLMGNYHHWLSIFYAMLWTYYFILWRGWLYIFTIQHHFSWWGRVGLTIYSTAGLSWWPYPLPPAEKRLRLPISPSSAWKRWGQVQQLPVTISSSSKFCYF